MNRTEKDSIGEYQIPIEVLYGIHSLRAKTNFPDNTPFHLEWFKALGLTKYACYLTYQNYAAAVRKKFPETSISRALMDEGVVDALLQAAYDIGEGNYFDSFIVPAISGGAGTSINMNINEIIANVALLKLGRTPGDYSIIHPIEHANVFQSTNDVVPTSLKVAVMQLLNSLEHSVNGLRGALEIHEKSSRFKLRVAYTQMQVAVPTSFGRLFSMYCEALSRDWWRVSKCFERIKTVNLGGSAIGSGITLPKYYIGEVVQVLQRASGLPVTRAENLYDATANLDAFAEVHGILKAHAVNLEKMVSDIRLLSSDVTGDKIMTIPGQQTGSSVMPGKINPVIPEFTVSVAHKVYANDMLITNLCALGCLELNAYLPTIGHAMIESLKLLIAANNSIKHNLVEGIVINEGKAIENLLKSPSVVTALLPYIGYQKAEQLAIEMKKTGLDIFEVNNRLQLIGKHKLEEILKPENLLQEGFSINDIISGLE
jgi:aspartate ammonia-lyase